MLSAGRIQAQRLSPVTLPRSSGSSPTVIPSSTDSYAGYESRFRQGFAYPTHIPEEQETRRRQLLLQTGLFQDLREKKFNTPTAQQTLEKIFERELEAGDPLTSPSHQIDLEKIYAEAEQLSKIYGIPLWSLVMGLRAYYLSRGFTIGGPTSGHSEKTTFASAAEAGATTKGNKSTRSDVRKRRRALKAVPLRPEDVGKTFFVPGLGISKLNSFQPINISGKVVMGYRFRNGGNEEVIPDQKIPERKIRAPLPEEIARDILDGLKRVMTKGLQRTGRRLSKEALKKALQSENPAALAKIIVQLEPDRRNGELLAHEKDAYNIASQILFGELGYALNRPPGVIQREVVNAWKEEDLAPTPSEAATTAPAESKPKRIDPVTFLQYLQRWQGNLEVVLRIMNCSKEDLRGEGEKIERLLPKDRSPNQKDFLRRLKEIGILP